MKLDRNNTNGNGLGRYVIIDLRKLGTIITTHEDLAVDIAEKIYLNPNAITLGKVGDKEEFFVLKLKDEYAFQAIIAYAHAASFDGEQEYAVEILDLAERARTHPYREKPD